MLEGADYMYIMSRGLSLDKGVQKFLKPCQFLYTDIAPFWRRQWHPTPVTLAWKIPWTEEPGGLQSMGLLRVEHDWATSLLLFTFMQRRNYNPLQCSCLEDPRDGGAWWAAIYGVAQSRTQLKWLSSIAPFSAFPDDPEW